ncbi:MAG: tyrosine-protein phosphatase [Sulfuricaulis sp.]|nr:tyrosine-protein phosphatase [Sulfuricaulis sp.]
MTTDAYAASVLLSGAPNFRDLGGVRTQDGRWIRGGHVFRSEALTALHEDDAGALATCGIRLVLDLRSAAESAAHPGLHWRSAGTEVLSFDIGTDVRAKGSFWSRLEDDASPAGVQALMLQIYRSLPLATLPALRTLFQRLASGASPLLIHCTAGKDRTGFVIAMLLHALGVPRSLILEDYLESERRIGDGARADAAQLLAEVSGQPAHDDSVALISGVRADYLAQSFAYIERKFGSVDAFLHSEAGLEKSQQHRIREYLLSAH